MIFKIDDEKFLDLEEVLKIMGWSFRDYYDAFMAGQFPKPQNRNVIMKCERTKQLWPKSVIDNFIRERRKRRWKW